MTTKAYDRWLKDAEAWLQEDDWSPDEYLKWTARLNQAKADLDDTFAEVDRGLLNQALEMAQKHEDSVMKSRPNGDFGNVNKTDISKLFVRPIIAYHFYQRSTFEDIPEKALVARVQAHMVALKIPIMDVPIYEAVEKQHRDYVQKIRSSAAVNAAYSKSDLSYDTPQFIKMLLQTRVDGGPVDRSKFEQIMNDINKKRVEEGYNPWGDNKLKNIQAAFSDDAKMELFLKRCAEPLVRNDKGDNHAATALEILIDAGELKTLIDLAVKQEKEKCSWEATIGPAVKALKRLGRTSTGKDMNRLAEYAKAHEKPVTV